MKRSFGILFLVCSLTAFAQPIAPTETNLRSAAMAGGSVTFSSSGTIVLSSPIIISLDFEIDGAGQSIEIDGQSATTLFVVNSGVRFGLKNLTLANGRNAGADGTNADGTSASWPGKPGYGGALRSEGVVTIRECVFRDNSAIGGYGYFPPIGSGQYQNAGGTAFGGAIWQSGGSLSIEGTTFLRNSAKAGGWTGGNGRGGAIYSLGGTVTISRALFATNSAMGGANAGWVPLGQEGAGGAVYVEGSDLSVALSNFGDNTARGGGNADGAGGAIAFRGGALQVLDTHLYQNVAVGGYGAAWRGVYGATGHSGLGGAIYVATGANAFVSGTTLARNWTTGGQGGYSSPPGPGGTSHGGGLYNLGTMEIINSTIANNRALQFEGDSVYPPGLPGDGGAIFNLGSLALTNATIVDNQSIGPVLMAGGGTFTLKNSLLGKNAGPNGSTGISDAGFNISGDATPQMTATGSLNNTDAKVGPLGDYSGPTPTVPLLLGSPAIDAIDDGSAPATDQRGRSRPSGAKSDVGAFESSAPFRIIGKLNGYVNGSVAVTNGTASIPVVNREFNLDMPAGSVSLDISATNTVFDPNPLVLNVTADILTQARGFAVQEFGFYPEMEIPTFAFGGNAGETWKFFGSYDLNQWFPIHTNQFTSAAAYLIPLTNLNAPVFLQAIRD